MDNKDILNRMFSSFVERRTRSSSSSYSHQSTLPPLQLRNFLHEHPTMPMLPKRSTSKVSSSNHAKQPRRTTPTSKSHAMARNSRDSVDAIATDSTPIQTPHHCDKCTKAFRQRSQLVRHYSRVHEKRKPFSCAHCDKSFASAFDRKRHVEAVHGRRCVEFFCDRCVFRSKIERELEEHIKTVHERDACRICGKVFKRSANLVAHERHYHSQS